MRQAGTKVSNIVYHWNRYKKAHERMEDVDAMADRVGDNKGAQDAYDKIWNEAYSNEWSAYQNVARAIREALPVQLSDTTVRRMITERPEEIDNLVARWDRA